MKYKIIVDSSCDLSPDYVKEQNGNVDFSIIPFVINVGEKEFIDTPNLNTFSLLSEIEGFNGKPVSACPSPQAYLEQMFGADKYFIITISAKLSGSFNSASVAKSSYKNPEDVCVIDSNLVSGAMILIVDKLLSLIQKNLDYKNTCKEILNYANNNTALLFTLNDYSNLVRNGRMSSVQAMLASTLHIKPLCKGEDGEIKVVKKVIGSKRVLRELITTIEQAKTHNKHGKCIIAHADFDDTATTLQKEISALKVFDSVTVIPTRGLCSFYAMRKGIIISYEK